MALDSAAKRISATHFLRSGIAPIFPDGTISQADRQSAIHSYGGILAATLTTGTASSTINNIWFFLFQDDD